jgi:retron-type reverse transcriptase
MVNTAALFDKIHKCKKHSHHNHEIHFMARDRQWLPKGIQLLLNGTYEPRCLKRYYFSDEMVDQLHISDRIFQHILLRILKPTFKHVMNSNCYHLDGPTGVKNATKKIREVLQQEQPKYFIRADIKSFYKSIPHHKLIEDIKKYYNDPKLIVMLKNIVKNPIDTPYGYKNPDHGIALRGPLSQFLSGIYLKPLDDAFNQADVTYLRYQDDILILCKTKRQLNRCKRRMMNVLQERQLRLSKRKTRIGAIESGFHFLGIAYPPTRTVDNTSIAPVDDGAIVELKPRNLNIEGGVFLYCKINQTAFYAWFRIRERCAKHASQSNGWSPMVFLAPRSNVILFDGYAGG